MFIPPPVHPLSHSHKPIEEDIQIHFGLPLGIVCILAITCCLGLLNDNLLCFVPTKRPSIWVYPMLFLNHVGCGIC